MLNQLNRGDTTDGRPAENYLYDCVPTCIAAMMQYITGTHFSPDALKDAAYGEAWTNAGTAAVAFVPYASAHGVHLYAINEADPIALAHKLIQSGRPALFTRDDPYSSNPGDSHVSVWYSEAPGYLIALDPWNAQSLTMTDQQWRSHLWNNEIWTVDMPIPTNWHDDGHTLTAKNGVPVVQGFRDHILKAANWDGDNVPQEAEYHADPVQEHGPQFGAGQRQVFAHSLLWWTQAKGVIDEAFLGLELNAAYAKIAALQAAYDTLKNTPAPASPDVKATVQQAIQELQKVLQ